MITVERDSVYNSGLPGRGLDGVVLIMTDSAIGTGTLLADGQSILTAAHLLADSTSAVDVFFVTSEGVTDLTASQYLIHPDYDTSSYGNDLGIVHLDTLAPESAQRYGLYRNNDELGRVGQMAGFGDIGTGEYGAEGHGGEQRTTAYNRIEATWSQIADTMPGQNVWHPPRDSQLVADFDSGRSINDTLGYFLGIHDLGLGKIEGGIAAGDSGGPLLINNQLAGVASYTALLKDMLGQYHNESGVLDRSYGEISAWQRVSYYQSWIDNTVQEFGASLSRAEQSLDQPASVYGYQLISGTDDPDVLLGGRGNNFFHVNGGNDFVVGGPGIDVAHFDSSYESAFVNSMSDFPTTVNAYKGGDNKLTDIELLSFNDRIVINTDVHVATVSAGGFDEAGYLARYPDIAMAVARGDVASGYEHYQNYGIFENRIGSVEITAFDRDFYLQHNPDVAQAVSNGSVDAAVHYANYGAHEGRSPNILFDEKAYREMYTDIDEAIKTGALDNGYDHFTHYGWKEGRNPSPWMDTSEYLKANPDIAAAGIDPMAHYLAYGMNEGRTLPAVDMDLWG